MGFEMLISKSAKKEIDTAYLFYLDRSLRIADKFIHEIYKYILEIQSNPTQFRDVRKKYKVCIVNRYPFHIYYFIDRRKVIVVSVFHTSRKPKRKFET
jgi:toxin ParE1/3/4